MPPNVNVTTTTNQYLAPFWVDQVLRDNYFFGKILGKTKKWDGSQMLFPKLSGEVKSGLIYGETPNYAIA
jgi:hypothetical protein